MRLGRICCKVSLSLTSSRPGICTEDRLRELWTVRSCSTSDPDPSLYVLILGFFLEHYSSAFMPAMVQNSSALPDPTKTTEPSSVSDAHPYVLAIDQIRVAITRHREYRDSLEDLREHSDNVVEDSHRSQSPLGFTNGAQTIEDIERILDDLDRSHPPPKLTHGSSKIEEDLLSTVDDRGQIAAPPVCFTSVHYRFQTNSSCSGTCCPCLLRAGSSGPHLNPTPPRASYIVWVKVPQIIWAI
jgi:hypothetical protein